MKKNEVKVGETYRCKVSGSMADVRIVAENRRGGWDAINVLTKRKVRIKSAQRLRAKTPAKPGKKRIVTKTKYEGGAKGKKKGQPKADKKKRASGLDAAAQVLGAAGEPLGCKEIVERMLVKGLWQTKGKTPAATIYAAVVREIAKKGKDARFRKVERGKFELAK